MSDAAGSCDSCHIVSASLDKSIIYWDVSTGAPVRRLRCHAGGVTCARFNEDSGLVVSGAKDNLAMCWDIRSRRLEPIQVLNEATDCITAVVVTNVSIVVASLDGCVRHYDLRAGQIRCDRIGPPVVHMAQTKDGQCTVAAGADNVVRLVDNATGALLAQYRGHRADDFRVECGIIASDSQIVSGSAEGVAVVWDLVEEREVTRLSVGKGVVHSLATHPTRDEVAFGWHRMFAVWGTMDEVE